MTQSLSPDSPQSPHISANYSMQRRCLSFWPSSNGPEATCDVGTDGDRLPTRTEQFSTLLCLVHFPTLKVFLTPLGLARWKTPRSAIVVVVGMVTDVNRSCLYARAMIAASIGSDSLMALIRLLYSLVLRFSPRTKANQAKL
jgi:hypothetical protein